MTGVLDRVMRGVSISSCAPSFVFCLPLRGLIQSDLRNAAPSLESTRLRVMLLNNPIFYWSYAFRQAHPSGYNPRPCRKP